MLPRGDVIRLLLEPVAPSELLYPAAGVYDSLLTCVIRMAVAAQLNAYLRFGGPGLEGVAATAAGHGTPLVFRVYVSLHDIWWLHRCDAYLLAVLGVSLEQDVAFTQGEKGMVSTQTHVGAGVDFSAPLPDDDGACRDQLAAIPFHPQPLPLAVSSVPAAASALFVGHYLASLSPPDFVVDAFRPPLWRAVIFSMVSSV